MMSDNETVHNGKVMQGRLHQMGSSTGSKTVFEIPQALMSIVVSLNSAPSGFGKGLGGTMKAP